MNETYSENERVNITSENKEMLADWEPPMAQIIAGNRILRLYSQKYKDRAFGEDLLRQIFYSCVTEYIKEIEKYPTVKY